VSTTTAAAVTIRPRVWRIVVWLAAAGMLAGATWVAVTTPPTGAGGAVPVQPIDRVATVGLGVILAGAVLVLARLRVTADDHGIRVRNLVGGYEFAWSSVRQVRFDRNSWWATLELLDGDEVSLLAVQVLDGQHAVAAVRTLRRLHAAHAGSGAGRGGSGAGGRAYDVAGSTDADAPDRDG
jgi:hypothetical protein